MRVTEAPRWRAWAALGACSALLSLSLTASPFATAQGLREPWRSAGWWAALRYRPAWGGGALSEVLTPSFFLSKEGPTDPRAEWEASVSALEGAMSALTAAGLGGGEAAQRRSLSPLCAYPDRFLIIARWLGEEAQLERRLSVSCPEFERWSKIAEGGVAWTHAGPIFTRPESSFGHASLWIKSAEGLEHALNFGAQLRAPLDRLWALLGVAAGDWTLRPYLSFERRYRELEGRDISRVTLSAQPGGGGSDRARRFLGLHLLSLRRASLRYSFFGNNCATQSARLLHVAAALAGEANIHPREERWGLSPLEALEPLIEGASEVSYHPSLAQALETLIRGLSKAEREALSRLNSEAARYVSTANSPPPRWAEGESVALWRASLASFELRYAEHLTRPPQSGARGLKARVWSGRGALLTGLSRATEASRLEPRGPSATLSEHPRLTPPDRVRLRVSAPLHQGWRDMTPLRWGVNLWTEPLSEPYAAPSQRLFFQGPSLWGQGLKAQGGRLFSLWNLSALNEPASQLSWQLTAGAGSHALGARSELAWLKGGLGGGAGLSALGLRAWLHLGGRLARSHEQTLALTPRAYAGARGALSPHLGWVIMADGGLSSYKLSWLSSEPLNLKARLRLSLSRYARLILEGRARGLGLRLDSLKSPQLWFGLEL